MTESSAQHPEPARSSLHAAPPHNSDIPHSVTTIMSSAAYRCPNCGASTMASVCPSCGEPVIRQPKPIRCRHCRRVSSSELTICPGCGRELRHAPPRWVTWGGTAALTVLALLVLLPAVRGARPDQWLLSQVRGGLLTAANLGEQLEPEVVIVMTPIAGEPGDADSKTAGEPQQVASIPSEVETAEKVSVVEVSLPTPTSTPQAPGPQMDAPIAAEISLPTSTPPAATVDATAPTSSPTPAQTPAASPTQPPATATAGTTAVAAPRPATSSTPTWTVSPTPVSAGVLARLPTPTVATGIGGAVGAIAVAADASEADHSTVTPLPAADETVEHEIKPGETLVSIAAHYGVPVEAIMEANNISGREVYVIQPGQVLTIPLDEAQSESQGGIRLDAPVLLSPDSGTPMSCSGQTTLVWERVQFIRDDDKYVLHLGFVSGRQENGDEIVTWVIAQPRPATQTSWDLDASLCSLASQSFGRQWRWWVEVVAGAEDEIVSVSPPSLVWGFSWN